jgi:hypothetical protein
MFDGIKFDPDGSIFNSLIFLIVCVGGIAFLYKIAFSKLPNTLFNFGLNLALLLGIIIWGYFTFYI